MVCAEVMTISPAATYKLLKVIARVKLFVLGREVVKNFGRGMHTGWGQAQLTFILENGSRLVTHCKRVSHDTWLFNS